jgi:prevent-host-death family protein
MREVRERIRAVVARVAEGNPLVIMQHGDPAAVLIRFDEAERWGRIERALAALHALEVYPELATGSGQLSNAVRGEVKPTRSAIRRLDEEPREILGPLETVQITDLRENLATNLEEVAQGHAKTVVSSGRFAASLISPREFDRLRRLHRTVSWFAAAGLDLGAADEAAIAAFVSEYRARTKTESAVG